VIGYIPTDHKVIHLSGVCLPSECLAHIQAAELAECLGVTPGFARKIKAGRRPLHQKYVLPVHERFNVPVSKLIDPTIARKQALSDFVDDYRTKNPKQFQIEETRAAYLP
jgi:hypothetical protein